MPAISIPALISMGLIGGIGARVADNTLSNSRNDLLGLAQTDPQGFTNQFGTLGNFNGGQFFQQSQQQQNTQGQLNQNIGFGLGGGFFNNPDFQNAFQNNNFGGASQAQQGLLQQQFQGAGQGLGGLFGNAQGLNNIFAQNVAQGPQDLTGGRQDQLFNFGSNFLNQANQGQGALIQQNLDASRALADPFERRQRQSVENSLFSQGRAGTTGGAQEFGDLLSFQGANDQRRILGAQQLGLQQQGQLGQLGLQSFGQGSNLFGQNLQGFGQNIQGFGQTGQLGQGLQGQGFQQMFQQLQGNQSAGQQRLQNAQNLFGIGQQSQQQGFQQGLQGINSQQQLQQIMNQLFLGNQNADANRIGAQGLFSQALGGIARDQASNQQGFFSGLADSFGGIF